MTTSKTKSSTKKPVAKKTVAKKPTAKKAVVKKAVVKKAVVKTTAAKKVAAKKPVAKKPVAKKVAEKKSAVKTVAVKKTIVKKATTPKKSDPELALAHFCVEAALDKKAESPVILDLRGISTFTDFFVLVSASSEPQIKAIAGCIRDRMRTEKGMPPHSDDAYPGSRWIVIDFGNIIVHIFHQELREIYDLESLWNDAKKISVSEKKRTTFNKALS